MDPLSITASLVSLAAVVRETVRLVQGIKDGGNDRLQMATEVKSLLIVLRSIEGFCETVDEDSTAPWIQALRSISEEGGILECASIELQKLNEILKPRTGHQKLIQSVRWPLLDKSGVERTLEHVTRLKQSMISVLEQANTSMTQSILSDTKDLHEALQSDNIHAILEWLSPLNMLAKQISLKEAYGNSSGKWLLDSQGFKLWKESKKDTMWCPGAPGAGKTVMSSIVAQHLQDESEKQNIGVFMLYISFNDPATQSIDGLLEALLKQTIQATNSLGPGVLDLYQRHLKNQTRPTRAELVSQIGLAFTKYSRVYLVLDALDELLEESARLSLIETLWSLDGDANMFVTSRFLPTIQQHFRWTINLCDLCEAKSMSAFYRCLDCPDWDACTNCYSLDKIMCVAGHKHMKCFHAYAAVISAQLEDLESYIRSRIKNSCSLESIVAKKSGLQKEIIDTVTRLAEERFLLAKFHMDTLASIHRPSQVSKALKDLPSRIDEIYDQAMQRINAAEQNREEAKALLRWVIHSYRPMHVREIEHATSVYPGQDDFDPDDIISADILCSWCAGLVVFEAGCLKLVHYTAKDYFLTSGAHWFSDGSTLLGQACLTYLSLNSSSATMRAPEEEEITTHWGAAAGEAATFFERAQDFPLLGYASMYWSAHLLKSEDDDLQTMACEFLRQSANVTTLTMVYRCLGCGSAAANEHRYSGNDLFQGASALHIASFWGLERLVNALVCDGSDVDATDEAGLTPLMYASIEGYPDIVDVLLKAGADVNACCVANCTALHRAILHGKEEVVEMLLRRKDLDLKIREDETGFTPLWAAIFQRKGGLVAKLLAIDDLAADEDCPPLLWAAYTGDAETVQVVLKHSTEKLNRQDKLGRTALLSAVKRDNNDDVIRVLLDAGADRYAADQDENTPILEAIRSGFTANVKALVQGDPSRPDQLHGLLHVAAQNNNHHVLRVLLEESKTLDIDSQDDEGRTALHYAALEDSPLIALTLLEHGASTAIKDISGHTPIELASQRFHITTYRILLEAGDHIASKLATSFSRVEMHVLSSPSPPSTPSEEYSSRPPTPVSPTKPTEGNTSNDFAKDIQVTSINCDLPLNLSQEHDDHFFQTRSALQHAVENGDPAIAKTLEDAGVDLNNYEENGDGPRHRLPLELRSPGGVIRVTELLVKHIDRRRGDNKGDVDNDSMTTLVDEEGEGEWRVALFLVTLIAT